MNRSVTFLIPGIAALALVLSGEAAAQDEDEQPQIKVGVLPDDLVLDGRLEESAWGNAPSIGPLTMVDPIEGEVPTQPTTVHVLANSSAIAFGIRCHDSEADQIVARTMERDVFMHGEDVVAIVLGTYLDGRTGYVFTVNPAGGRRDSLVVRRGEREDPSWDGIWEARCTRDEDGWTAEIRIPILTLSYRSGLTTWHFNVQRMLRGGQQTNRWAGAQRDYKHMQTSRAGLLTGLPEFNPGVGLSVTPSVVMSYGRPEANRKAKYDYDGSLDVTQRLTPELMASLTLHTDFSETEVDTRQTNLTRFPLFFPEKRAFFLEGSDLYEFGIGLNRDLVPFHSRRIGLIGGEEIPLVIGGKVNGRANGTSIGALAVKTDDVEGVADETNMGVLRLRQDVLKESSIGMIATVGDPLDREDSVVAGPDAVFQTSEFLGGMNLLAGAWALYMHRDDTDGAGAAAYGASIDFPNDPFDASLTWKRIGREFDPSIGFVSRTEVHQYDFTTLYRHRPDTSWIREIRWSQSSTLWTDLNGHWESYRVRTWPFYTELEDGDGFGGGLIWEGDKPDQDFSIAPNIVVPRGTYEWFRGAGHFETAQKRWWKASAYYEAGDYYGGNLTRLRGRVTVDPFPLLTASVTGERNIGDLPGGRFRRDLLTSRVRLNLTPDFNFSSFVQFDTDSKNIGTFSRLHWALASNSDLFVVYTYNWLEDGGTLDPQTYEGTLKFQYTLRF